MTIRLENFWRDMLRNWRRYFATSPQEREVRQHLTQWERTRYLVHYSAMHMFILYVAGVGIFLAFILPIENTGYSDDAYPTIGIVSWKTFFVLLIDAIIV